MSQDQNDTELQLHKRRHNLSCTMNVTQEGKRDRQVKGLQCSHNRTALITIGVSDPYVLSLQALHRGRVCSAVTTGQHNPGLGRHMHLCFQCMSCLGEGSAVQIQQDSTNHNRSVRSSCPFIASLAVAAAASQRQHRLLQQRPVFHRQPQGQLYQP